MAIHFVDHNYGGTDELAYQTIKGSGVSRADIRVFTKEDWDKGNHANRFAVGRSATTTSGKWLRAIPLNPGRYVVVFSKEGFERSVAEFEVA